MWQHSCLQAFALQKVVNLSRSTQGSPAAVADSSVPPRDSAPLLRWAGSQGSAGAGSPVFEDRHQLCWALGLFSQIVDLWPTKSAPDLFASSFCPCLLLIVGDLVSYFWLTIHLTINKPLINNHFHHQLTTKFPYVFAGYQLTTLLTITIHDHHRPAMVIRNRR